MVELKPSKLMTRVRFPSPAPCPDGETGRHKRLKISRLNGCAGSIPAPGTISK